MNKYVAHVVPCESTLEYIVETLGDGQTLLRTLAITVRRTVGTCVIYAPSGFGTPRLLVDQGRPLVFESESDEGGQDDAKSWNRDFESTQHLMAHLAFERVSAKDGRVLVVEDQTSDRSFPAEKRWTHDKVYSGELVYRILSSASAGAQDDALEIVRGGAGWLFAIACADVDRASFAPSGGDITKADITRIADRTTWIGLEAFDGDGLIIWSREEP